MKPSRLFKALVLAAGISCAPLACNVFVTADRCVSDSECPSGFVCDPVGRFCLDRRADASSPDVAVPPVDAADAEVGDSTPDAESPCDRSAPFGAMNLVSGLEQRAISSARLSSDERTAIFAALNGCSQEHCVDLFVATRPSRAAPFVVSGPLTTVNSSASAEYWPTLSSDGLLLFFESGRSLQKVDGGYVNDQARIWSATRVNLVAEFDEPRIQSIFAVDGVESSPYLHPSGKSLYFASNARGGAGAFDIFVAKLDPLGLASEIANVAAANTAGTELMPVVTLDERHLYFSREVPVQRDIFVSSRATASEPFGPAVAATDLNSPYDDFPSWISEDACRFYFVSTRPLPGVPPGEARLWVASRP